MNNTQFRSPNSWNISQENQNRFQERGENRRRLVEQNTSKEKRMNGKKVLSFSENDYLGLSRHPKVVAAYKRGIDEYGCYSSPALMTGFTTAHAALEEELAAFVNMPRILLFTSGYIANLGVISALLNRSDTIVHDRLNHLSLLDASFLAGAELIRYKHRDLNSLNQALSKKNNGRLLIATDGVFSMDGVLADIASIASIAKKNNAWLMVDDAHGLGHLGKTGKGTLEHLNVSPSDIQILMGTFSKGFGTSGAFIAGSEELIRLMIDSSHPYLCSSSLPAAVAEATRAALQVIKTETWRRDKLFTLVKQFKTGATQLGYNTGNSESAIQPIFLGDPTKTLDVSQRLMEKGIHTSPIRHPIVPIDSARIRISINADHTEQHIQRLLQALEEIKSHGDI
jgi:8-amino-7-oxononanoate synthase